MDQATLIGGASNNTFTLNNWTGNATINGSGGTGDTLSFTRDANMTLNNGAITLGTKTITFTAVETLNLIGGAANNVIALGANFKAAPLANLSLNGGTGTDTVSYAESDANATTNVFTVTATSLSANTVTANIAGIETVNYTGDDDIDDVHFTNFAGGGSVTGGLGTNTLFVNRSGNFTLSKSTLVVAGSTINHSDVLFVNLFGGSGSNSFTINSTGTGVAVAYPGSVSIQGLGGVDTLTLNSNATSVAVSDVLIVQAGLPNWGLSGDIEVVNLVGSATTTADQKFDLTGFTNGAAFFDLPANSGVAMVASTVNGGLGADTVIRQNLAANENVVLTSTQLKYTPAGAGVRQKLTTISSVERAYLVGNSGADSIDASAAVIPLVLIGNGGNDVLKGGGQRDFLIGGDGMDTLTGGLSDDILLGGITTYDDIVGDLNDLAKIDAVMAAWLNTTDTYATRRTNVLALADFRLIAHAQDDDDVDSLTGNGGTDWFFAELDAGVDLENPTDDVAGETVDDIDP